MEITEEQLLKCKTELDQYQSSDRLLNEKYNELVNDFVEQYDNFKNAVEDGFFERLTSLYDENQWRWQEDAIQFAPIEDPVMLDDGHVYSRQTLIDWRDHRNAWNQNHMEGDAGYPRPFTSPNTNVPLNDRYLQEDVIENLPRVVQFQQALEQLEPLRQMLQDPSILNQHGVLSIGDEDPQLLNTPTGIIRELNNYMREALEGMTEFRRKLNIFQKIVNTKKGGKKKTRKHRKKRKTRKKKRRKPRKKRGKGKRKTRK